MSFLRLVSTMTAIKYRDLTARRAVPVHTPTPLGLHQGSVVEIDPAIRLVMSTKGGKIGRFESNQTVTLVGQYTMFGFHVSRSYLSDGKSFIETVADATDPKKSAQTRLYVSYLEAEPGEAGWQDLLAEQDGRIGLETFSLFRDDAKQDPNDLLNYRRMWFSDGGFRVMPQVSTETLTAPDGKVQQVEHRMMQYGLTLGTGGPNDPVEYLLTEAIIILASAAGGEERASYNVYLGMDLGPAALKIYPA